MTRKNHRDASTGRWTAAADAAARPAETVAETTPGRSEPSFRTIHTSTGAVHVTTREATGDRIVVLEAPDAPKHLRLAEAGRLAKFGEHLGFQPAPFAPWVMGAEALRAIADLIEQEG